VKRDPPLFENLGDAHFGDAVTAPPFERVFGAARRQLARRRAKRAGAGVIALLAFALIAAPEERGTETGLADRLLATSHLYEGPTTFLLESRPTPIWRRGPLMEGGAASRPARPTTRLQPADPPPGRG